MSQNLIEAISLSQSFDYPLYDGISLSLRSGQSMAVVGRSGSGKSTLLHTLATFLPPDEGVAKLLGQDIYSQSEKEIEMTRRDQLGIIFQSHYLFKGMTGRENVRLAGLLSGQSIDNDLLKSLQIEDVVDQKIGDLSGGQQQRVSIARVLSKKPRVIFADEPTGNLDNETATLVMDVLLEYIKQNDGALFLVTHDLDLASRCDKCYTLENQSLKLTK